MIHNLKFNLNAHHYIEQLKLIQNIPPFGVDNTFH